LWYVATPARSVTPTVIDDKTEASLALVAVMTNCPAVAGAVYVTGELLGVLEELNVPQETPLQPGPVALQLRFPPSPEVAVNDRA